MNRNSSFDELSEKIIEEVFPVADNNGIPAFYIINYKGGGFILLSADNRVDPVLAYSDKNFFPLNNASYPGGLVEWMNDTKEGVEHLRQKKAPQTLEVANSWTTKSIQRIINNLERKTATAKRASFGDEPMDPPDDVCLGESIWRGPLLQTTWGQGDGYNNYCPLLGCTNTYNGRALTGCVATAMAQLIRFHEYPARYSYSAMPIRVSLFDTGYGAAEVARLMYDAGRGVHMDYGCGSSSAYSKDIPNALRTIFMYSSANQHDYNVDGVISELNDGRPVILSGGRVDYDWLIIPTYENGHAWVCDGYAKYISCDYQNGVPVGTHTTIHLYMNWGWNGSYDGLYFDNRFNPGNSSFNYKTKMVFAKP